MMKKIVYTVKNKEKKKNYKIYIERVRKGETIPWLERLLYIYSKNESYY